MKMIVEVERIIDITEIFLDWGIVTPPYEYDSRRRANVHINKGKNLH